MTILDIDGNPVTEKDLVTFLLATDELLRNLGENEQAFIRSFEGQALEIISFDTSGNAELSIQQGDEYHFIWVSGKHLRKV